MISAIKNAAADWWSQVSRNHDFHTEAASRLFTNRVNHLLPGAVNPVEMKRNLSLASDFVNRVRNDLSLASDFVNRVRNACLSFGKGSGSDTK